MGKRGPCKTPTEVLATRGSWRAAARKNEAPKIAGDPAMPDFLTADQQCVWREVVDMTKAMGVLSAADFGPLARYAVLMEMWKNAVIKINEKGATILIGVQDIVNPETHEVAHQPVYRDCPEVGLIFKLGEAMLKIEREFGLTPAARSNIQMGARDAVDDQKERSLDE